MCTDCLSTGIGWLRAEQLGSIFTIHTGVPIDVIDGLAQAVQNANTTGNSNRPNYNPNGSVKVNGQTETCWIYKPNARAFGLRHCIIGRVAEYRAVVAGKRLAVNFDGPVRVVVWTILVTGGIGILHGLGQSVDDVMGTPAWIVKMSS